MKKDGSATEHVSEQEMPNSFAAGPCTQVLTTASSSLPHRYAFFHLLQAPEPRYALLQQTQLVIYLLDLLLDKCEAVRRMANLCLDVVIETDETWAPQIRQRKFQIRRDDKDVDIGDYLKEVFSSHYSEFLLNFGLDQLMASLA